MQARFRFGSRLVAAMALTLLTSLPLNARSVDPSVDYQERLARGEVVVGLKNTGSTRFVTGTVVINEPPEQVWPIMTNPFEFKGKISPRMKKVEVMVDKVDKSVLKVELDMSILIPNFVYVVESRYKAGERIDFQRVGGVLKDFKGSWEMSPVDGGKKTQLVYSMYVDPGFFVPQWIVREGVKGELPRTLSGLRERVEAVAHSHQVPEAQTIMAAANNAHITTASTGQTF